MGRVHHQGAVLVLGDRNRGHRSQPQEQALNAGAGQQLTGLVDASRALFDSIVLSQDAVDRPHNRGSRGRHQFLRRRKNGSSGATLCASCDRYACARSASRRAGRGRCPMEVAETQGSEGRVSGSRLSA